MILAIHVGRPAELQFHKRRVLQEGVIESGQPIAVVRTSQEHLTVSQSISEAIDRRSGIQ
jgi:MOSC domain-containing protein YiiM